MAEDEPTTTPTDAKMLVEEDTTLPVDTVMEEIQMGVIMISAEGVTADIVRMAEGILTTRRRKAVWPLPLPKMRRAAFHWAKKARQKIRNAPPQRMMNAPRKSIFISFQQKIITIAPVVDTRSSWLKTCISSLDNECQRLAQKKNYVNEWLLPTAGRHSHLPLSV